MRRRRRSPVLPLRNRSRNCGYGPFLELLLEEDSKFGCKLHSATSSTPRKMNEPEGTRPGHGHSLSSLDKFDETMPLESSFLDGKLVPSNLTSRARTLGFTIFDAVYCMRSISRRNLTALEMDAVRSAVRCRVVAEPGLFQRSSGRRMSIAGSTNTTWRERDRTNTCGSLSIRVGFLRKSAQKSVLHAYADAR